MYTDQHPYTILSKHQSQTIEEEWVKLGKDHVPTFNWVFENQPIAYEYYRYTRAESNLLAHEIGPQQGGPSSAGYTSKLQIYYLNILHSVLVPYSLFTSGTTVFRRKKF